MIPSRILLAAAVAGAPIVLGDSQNYSQGSYTAYASPWSTFFDHSLIRGRDYADTITVDPARFPDNTVIDTLWPVAKPEKSGVWGYHAVSFGNYDGGHPPRPVPPRQVRNIRRLSEQFVFDYNGSSSFNLLNEFYLTSRAGDAAAKVIEIGIFLHAPPSSMQFIRRGRRIATIQDSVGKAWLVTQTQNYVTIVRSDGADLPRGRIDLRGLLAMLVRARVITGNEWFNGIALGTEPTEGAGRTRIRIAQWRVAYA